MNNLFTCIAHLFRKPTAHNIAQEKLDQARIKVLEHQEAANYHLHLQQFYEKQVAELNSFLNQQKGKMASPNFDEIMLVPPAHASVRRNRVKAPLTAAA